MPKPEFTFKYTPLQSGPQPMAHYGCGPSWTRASDAGRLIDIFLLEPKTVLYLDCDSDRLGLMGPDPVTAARAPTWLRPVPYAPCQGPRLHDSEL